VINLVLIFNLKFFEFEAFFKLTYFNIKNYNIELNENIFILDFPENLHKQSVWAG